MLDMQEVLGEMGYGNLWYAMLGARAVRKSKSYAAQTLARAAEKSNKPRREKLTVAQVHAIRAEAGTQSLRKQAAKYGVTHKCIGLILSGKRWKNV